MLHGLLLAAALLGAPYAATDRCMCFMYTNRDQSRQVWIGQHYFDYLVRNKWCVRVYTRKVEGKTVHVCVE